LNASEGIALAYGNVYLDDKIAERVGKGSPHPGKDGRTRKYNAVYIMQDGKYVEKTHETRMIPKGIQPKTLLPTYRIFDDQRYFYSLKDVSEDFGFPFDYLAHPFNIKVGDNDVNVGFELCEDLFVLDYRYDGEALNITKTLTENGAEIIVNLSASPWTYGKNAARDRRVKFLKEDSDGNFTQYYYVNCVGAQNNGKNIVAFDGGSTVYNDEGEPVIFSKEPYKEELMIIDTDKVKKNGHARIEKSRIAQKYDAIIRGIQHVTDMAGFKEHPNYVIGLSGGVDSAVVAALVSQAVGADREYGINMPTKFNSEKTRSAARHVAEQLGIAFQEVPIGDLVAQTEESIDSITFYREKVDLNAVQRGNIHAKIRGTDILSNEAAKRNGLMTNNGNKLETALGYATLYGDVDGAVAPLADLLKTEVFEMARYLNDEIFKKEVIPRTLLPDELFRFTSGQILPTAELEKDQIDPMKFGYHDALLNAFTDYMVKGPTEVMKWYLEGTMEKNLGISTELIKRWNIDDPKVFVEDLEWFDRAMHNAVYKRIQTGPVIITSKTAFGFDRRESILPYETTIVFDELKEKILKEVKSYQPRGVA